MSRLLLDQALTDTHSAELIVSDSEEREIRKSLARLGLKKLMIESKKNSDQSLTLSVRLPVAEKSVPVSVVIPCYNRTETQLTRVVESTKRALSELPGAEHEILLMDDASPVAVLALSGTRVLRNEKNQGVSATRNRGLSESKNDFVFFIDSDDEVRKNHLTLLLAQLLAGADVAASSMSMSGGKVFTAGPLDLDHMMFENTFGSGFGINKQSRVIQSIVEKCGGLFNTELVTHYEDWELNILLMQLGAAIALVPSPTYIYHDDESSRNQANPSVRYHAAVSAPIHALKRFNQIRPDQSWNQSLRILERFKRELELIHSENDLYTQANLRTLLKRWWKKKTTEMRS